MVDVNYSFTEDSPRFWDGFWDRNAGLGGGGSDPDVASPTLKQYHKLLWSKELPNGEIMELQKGKNGDYLVWNDFKFGSDSIIVSFRYYTYRDMMSQVGQRVGDFHKFVEDYMRGACTIGGYMIFPKHVSSMNQNKGIDESIEPEEDELQDVGSR